MSAVIDTVRAGKFEIPVLYEDNHLLVVVKPANMGKNIRSRARSIWAWCTAWTVRWAA